MASFTSEFSEPPEGFQWPGRWVPTPTADGLPRIEAELQREVNPGHMLYRVACRVVGVNEGYHDDYLFITENPAAPLVYVHLTMSRSMERNPRCPVERAYPSWEAFRAAHSRE